MSHVVWRIRENKVLLLSQFIRITTFNEFNSVDRKMKFKSYPRKENIDKISKSLCFLPFVSKFTKILCSNKKWQFYFFLNMKLKLKVHGYLRVEEKKNFTSLWPDRARNHFHIHTRIHTYTGVRVTIVKLRACISGERPGCCKG